MIGPPLIEPATPEFGTHQGCIGAQLLEAGKLMIDIGSCTEIHGPNEIIEAILLEIRAPVALEKNWEVLFRGVRGER